MIKCRKKKGCLDISRDVIMDQNRRKFKKKKDLKLNEEYNRDSSMIILGYKRRGYVYTLKEKSQEREMREEKMS